VDYLEEDTARRERAEREQFDDMPTEVTRDPQFYNNDYDADGGETEVRHDALELLREARTGIAPKNAPARPASTAPAVPGFTDDEHTTQMDGPDDLTEIIRDARDLRKKRRP
ncbi:MAG: hypothetical protein JWM74_5165, partial [Myxococcaceae bacterium]|nr:hypothetical protein [Myxococcaceae bacterium]